MSIETELVGFLEESNHCTAGLVLPPPAECGWGTRSVFFLAQYHVITIILFVFVAGILIDMTWKGLFPPGGGGH